MHIRFNESMPELANDVSTFITQTVSTKRVPTELGSLWQDKYLPGILKWLDELVKKGTERDKEDLLFAFTEDARGINVPTEIKHQSKKIRLQLGMHFARNPPFTLLRICELVADPAKAGYDISRGNAVILKFFNSFAKLVVVSSSLGDFPQETFSATSNGNNKANFSNGKDKDTSSVAMVRIPWLPDVESEPEVSEDSIDAEQVISQDISLSDNEVHKEIKEIGDILPEPEPIQLPPHTAEGSEEKDNEILEVETDPITNVESPEPYEADEIPTSPDIPPSAELEVTEQIELTENGSLTSADSGKRSASDAGLEDQDALKKVASEPIQNSDNI